MLHERVDFCQDCHDVFQPPRGGFPILAVHESIAFLYLQLLIYLSRAITQDGH